METDELYQSPAPTLTSQDTRIARSTDIRLSPALPPGHFHRTPRKTVPAPNVSHHRGTYIKTPKCPDDLPASTEVYTSPRRI